MKRTALFGGLLVFVLCIGAIATATPTHAAAVARESPQGCENSLAAETSRAALVVTFGDGHSEMFCIEFSDDSITGLEQLQRSGLTLVTNGSGGLGSAVCSIGGEGSSDPTNCFASCTGGSCQYWAYYRYQNGSWKFSQVGASQTAVRDGDIFGWSWGPGGSSGAPEPPGEICPVQTSTPLARATPVLPPPTATPEPVPEPSATEAPLTPRPTQASDPPTAEPSGSPPPAEPSPEPAQSAPMPGGPAPEPTRSPESAVQGAALSPATATNTTVSTAAARSTTSASPTPRSGAVVIDDKQGAENQAGSESQSATEGGSELSLIAFAIVAVALISAGGVFYWRRRAV
jgi:hypothetical protein